jgi:NADH-quinone oxidoreductase subunit N
MIKPTVYMPSRPPAQNYMPEQKSGILEFDSMYNSSWVDSVGLLPEIYLSLIILAGLFIVASSNFNPKANIIEKKKNVTPLIYNVILFGFMFTILFYIINNYSYWSTNTTSTLFNGYAILDGYSSLIKISVVFTTLVVFWNSKSYMKNNPRHLMEFPILIALTCLFLLILVSSYNLMTMFLGVVGFSLNVYVLLLYDSMNHASREAGVKYYYLSTFSSGLLLSGVFFAYLIFQTTDFLQIKMILGDYIKILGNSNARGEDMYLAAIQDQTQIFSIMIYFLIFGFLFKLAAFPCHAWAPEVYEGSPNPITALFVLPIKIATLGFFIRLLSYVFYDLYYIWSFAIWFASIFSMLWGCFGALVEKSFKKFVAFASINQMGFLLIGLACGTEGGIRASLIYLLIYAVMNLGLFIIFLNTSEVNSKRNIGYLTDFTYFAKNNWLYSITLVIILFSMAGIPPLAGFFGKYYLLLHAFESELYSLVIVGMFCSLVSTYYYLRIIKIMWFEKQPENIDLKFETNIDKKNQYLLYTMEIILVQFIFLNNIIFEYFTKLTTYCISIFA